jgi:DNA-binding winged helix-turn-helix (wHTH) protein/Tfp pilus assembly protein PilF
MTTPADTMLAFAGYVLDVRRRLLIGPDGAVVDISSRAFELLHYLASHPHELIDKQRLMKAVWHNTFVAENNLHQQISALRKVLGEAAGEHRFIVTVTGQGFRFVQNVERVASAPAAVAPSAIDANQSTPDIQPGRRYLRPVVTAAISVMLIAGATYALWVAREPAPPRFAASISAAQHAARAGTTRNVEAYEAYLAARAVMNRFGSSHAREAIELLERAVHLDADFALAWAALAEAYTYIPSAPPLTPLQLQQRISSAALRAFELAPDAPETLRSAGMVSMQNRHWAEADRRLHRAVELAGPYNYDSNMLYATFLMNVGRVRDAVPYVERAMRAEPLLLRPVVFRAALHEVQGDLAAAESLLNASAALGGHDSMRKQGLIMIGLARHDRHALRRLLVEDGAPCPMLDDAPPLARKNLRRDYDDARMRGTRTDLLPMADFAVFLGDRKLSLEAVFASASSQNLHGIWRAPLREVRRLPEFEEFVRKVGLVEYWRTTGEWGDFCHDAGNGRVTCR